MLDPAVLVRTQVAGPHAVRFSDDEFAVDAVAEFLDGALRAGDAAIVIATAPHRAQLLPHLNRLGGIDRRRPWWPGELIMLDARETLDRFMVDGWPDDGCFKAIIGQAIDAASRNGERAVRVFGEMVSVLCADGQREAAVRLEVLWNELRESRPAFSLLCCYPLRLFADAGDEGTFREICAAHTEVLLPEAPASAGDSRELAMTLAALQQKALALTGEVARRTAAEQTLRRREKELADFLENAAEGLHSVDANGTILWANRAELQMLGYAADEYIGHDVAEFHAEPRVIARILQRLHAGETLRDEPVTLRCKDGTRRHVLLTSNAYFENGELLYTRCFTHDVSERRAREQAERERNDLVMRAPVAAALTTGNHHVVRLANPPFCAMLGCDDLVGRPLREAEVDDPALAALTGWLDRAYAAGEPLVIEEYAAGAGDGDAAQFFKLSLEPMRAADGGLYGVMVVGVDVSTSVRARRRLEQANAERARLLEELRAANRAKDEFLAMLGHELRNPLSPIVTALQLMKLRGDLQSSREQAIIQRQVDHLIRLVDDLLDISRIIRGKIELRFEPVEIGQVIARAVEIATLLIEQRRHRVEIDVPSTGLRWVGDATRLAQVVSNLLTNAARYTDPGGLVRLSAARDGEHITISVRDNGRGMASDLLPRVFDLFFQGHQQIDRPQGGLGIGLALVKTLVELHGGTVRACSDGPGCGSEFIVRLPVRHAPSGVPVVSSPKAGVASGTQRRRILIVDDNADAAELLGELLRANGHQVVVVHDAPQALAALPALAPDIALLDIGLPVMSGLELAQQLRQQGWSCRLVALTGYGQDADRQRTLDAGFEDHLVKPVDTDRLLRIVQLPVHADQGDARMPAGNSVTICGNR